MMLPRRIQLSPIPGLVTVFEPLLALANGTLLKPNKNSPPPGGEFFTFLEKICVFLAFLGVILLEHSRVRQEIRVVELLCAGRAVGRAGTAFDARSGDFRRVFRVYRAHRTQLGAQAALFAQHCRRVRLCLEEFRGRFVRLERRVVGCLRVTRYLRAA